MPLSEERIYYLLRSYTEERTTDAEEMELFEWAATKRDNGELETYIRQLMKEHEADRFPEIDWNVIYKKVYKDTHKVHLLGSLKKRNKLRTAAVFLVLILAGGAYLIFGNKQQDSDVAKKEEPAFKNDIKPGEARAILKSAGREVVLDKRDTGFSLEGNRIMVSKGNIQMENTGSAQYTLVVPKGGKYSIQLSEGVRVWLNSESKLVYASKLKGNNREVSLEGEAYFKINPLQEVSGREGIAPFIIKAGNQRIKVLGTEFNVEAYPDEATSATTLIRGRVRVDNDENGKRGMILEPGQQAETDVSGKFTLHREVDVNQVTAWKKDYFQFDNVDIRTIMKQLARWYDIKVVYAENLPEHHFGAIMSRDNNISGILKMLEATGDVHFEIDGKVVTVMR